MYLIVEHTKIPDPSDTQIVAVLEDVTEDGNLFAILAIDDQTYIQTAITPHGLVVAYREGSEESHCESTSQTHDLETVKKLFLLYRTQDPRYKTLVEYGPFEVEGADLPLQFPNGLRAADTLGFVKCTFQRIADGRELPKVAIRQGVQSQMLSPPAYDTRASNLYSAGS
jgi:hypothetical protein